MSVLTTLFRNSKTFLLSAKQALSPWKNQPLSKLQKARAIKTLSANNGTVKESQLVLQRQQAAGLIEAVLDDILSPTQALIRWPVQIHSHNPKHTAYRDINSDPSLQAAYQILWHFEADETQQQQELFYLDTQLALLHQVAETLAKGQDLPIYLLEQYTTEHKAQFYSGFSFGQSVGEFFKKPIRSVIELFFQVLPHEKRPL